MLRLSLLPLCAYVLLAQDGAAIYKTHCAGCHDHPVGRMPPVSALQAMSVTTILAALNDGAMKTQAAGLTQAERSTVAAYLSKMPTTPAVKAAARMCPAGKNVSAAAGAEWSNWGANALNTRFQSARDAGITPAQVPSLQLRWAFDLGEGSTPRSQPAVADGRVLVGGDTKLYALDARSGCTYWAFAAENAVRTGIVIGKARGSNERTAYFGDLKANLYAVSFESGRLLWKTKIDDHFAAMMTGTPALDDGVLYAGVSSYEEVMAADAKYPCCTFRGSVVAVDAATGKQIWKTYTVVADPVNTRGPSGAGVWSTPTVDARTRRIYVATGDNYSGPSTKTSDAVLALDAGTGKMLWSQQATADDIYNSGCDMHVAANCPATHGNDFDFGQPPMLVNLGDGKRALILGQKSALVYAFDPDDNGKPLWNRRIGEGGSLGGIQWGSAAEGDRVYVALSDLRLGGVADPKSPQGYRLVPDPKHGGGLFALRTSDGEVVWSAKPPDCGDRKPCSPAQSAPVSAIPGVVFSGALDGHLRGYASATGAVIWDVDTAREYEAVNGGEAHGGSIDVTGPVIVDGMVYSTSGYGQWGGMPGNVLLAYSAR